MYTFSYRAEFVISHPRDSLEDAATLLRKRPSKYIRKGRSYKRPRPAERSVLNWILHPGRETVSDRAPLERTISRFLREIVGESRRLSQALRGGGRASLQIAIRPETSYSVFTLDPDILRELASLGIELEICCVV